MRRIVLFAILMGIISSSTLAYQLVVFEPMDSITLVYGNAQDYRQPYTPNNPPPIGTIIDVFLDQYILTGVLSPLSQYYSGNGVINYVHEYCDNINGVNQLFTTNLYPVPNPYNSPLAAGIIDITPTDLLNSGIIPPAGFQMGCWQMTMNAGARMIILPNQFSVDQSGTCPIPTGCPGSFMFANHQYYWPTQTLTVLAQNSDAGQTISGVYTFELSTMTLVASNTNCGNSCSYQLTTVPNKAYVTTICETPNNVCKPAFAYTLT